MWRWIEAWRFVVGGEVHHIDVIEAHDRAVGFHRDVMAGGALPQGRFFAEEAARWIAAFGTDGDAFGDHEHVAADFTFRNDPFALANPLNLAGAQYPRPRARRKPAHDRPVQQDVHPVVYVGDCRRLGLAIQEGEDGRDVHGQQLGIRLRDHIGVAADLAVQRITAGSVSRQLLDRGATAHRYNAFDQK